MEFYRHLAHIIHLIGNRYGTHRFTSCVYDGANTLLYIDGALSDSNASVASFIGVNLFACGRNNAEEAIDLAGAERRRGSSAVQQWRGGRLPIRRTIMPTLLVGDIAVNDVVLVQKPGNGLDGCLGVVKKAWEDGTFTVRQHRRGAPPLDDGIFTAAELVWVGRMPSEVGGA